MAKRNADKDLNHDNWDQEDDEEEEAGVFRLASKDVIEKREIKRAKRRIQNEGGSTSSGSSALKGFSFGTLGSSTPFSFAAQPSSTLSDANKAATCSFKFSSTVGSSTIATTTSSLASLSCTPAVSFGGAKANEQESEYRKSLRNLNESVLRWIEDHIKKNPFCILSPVFSDYDNYIKQLEKDFLSEASSKLPAPFVSFKPAFTLGAEAAKSTPMDVTPSSATTTTVAKEFSFKTATTSVVSSSGLFGSGTSSGFPAFGGGVQSPKQEADKPTPTVGFSFGQSAKDTSAASSSSSSPAFKPFSFGNLSSAGGSLMPASSGFHFGSGLPSTSAKESDGAQETPQTGGDGDDANYVPPKPEVVDIQEDDAFHTVRCKLYFKIDNEFKDRGVGNLYLKPCGEKTQLLVRAGTTLGNILLNIMLNKNIPTHRQDNKITMVCVPNPPLSEKGVDTKAPICMMIRVKTNAEAEELFTQINNRKV